MSMNLVEQIAAKAAALPLEKQREALQIIESLATQSEAQTAQPRKSLLGLFADRGVDVTSEDIDEVRREIWANFPREDI